MKLIKVVVLKHRYASLYLALDKLPKYSGFIVAQHFVVRLDLVMPEYRQLVINSVNVKFKLEL